MATIALIGAGCGASTDTPREKPIGESGNSRAPITHTVRGEFKITYPGDWELPQADVSAGIAAFWARKFDPMAKVGVDGLMENYRSIMVNIFPLNGLEFDLLIKSIPENEEVPANQISQVTINGKRGIQFPRPLMEGNGTWISTILEYKNDKYIWIDAQYGKGSEEAEIVETFTDIIDSFEVL